MEKISGSMLSMDAWGGSRMWNGISCEEKPRYNPVAEFRSVKHEAQSAIADLLTMLPKDDVRCGMARVLAEWLDAEIESLPDTLHVSNDEPKDDY